jgi:hypothetical protein
MLSRFFGLLLLSVLTISKIGDLKKIIMCDDALFKILCTNL